jgi:hypothetical protein
MVLGHELGGDRALELDKSNDCLEQVKKAKDALRDKARKIFGEKDNLAKQKSSG